MDALHKLNKIQESIEHARVALEEIRESLGRSAAARHLSIVITDLEAVEDRLLRGFTALSMEMSADETQD